jgi:hypothetical protein
MVCCAQCDHSGGTGKKILPRRGSRRKPPDKFINQMKTNLSTRHLIAAFGLVASTAAMYAETSPYAELLAPSMAMVTMTVTTGSSAPVVYAPVATSSEVASTLWADIKDITYDMRAQFFPGFKRMEARVDDQFNELTAKRATMKGTTGTKEWDFAMKEMEDSRAYLQASGEEMGKATSETWDQQRDKVGQAWLRTQAAYDKVKASTTT